MSEHEVVRTLITRIEELAADKRGLAKLVPQIQQRERDAEALRKRVGVLEQMLEGAFKSGWEAALTRQEAEEMSEESMSVDAAWVNSATYQSLQG